MTSAAAIEAGGESRHLAIFLRSLEGGGGAERMMVSLAAAFEARGHRVDLVLGAARGSFLGAVPAGVRLVELGRRSGWRALPLLLREPEHARKLLPALRGVVPHWVLGCIPALAAYLERERPDAMLSALDYSNLAALWARRVAGVPTRVVVSERNTMSLRARERRRNRGLPALAAAFYPWADGIAAVSDGVADDLSRVARIPRSEIATTYNPVVDDDMPQRTAEPVAHPWFAPDARVPVVLAAGKLKRQKGFDTLIDAFARLRARRPVRLVILGQGELRRGLLRRAQRQGVAGDLWLPGFVDNPFAFMARASVFVLSSRFEGLPGVLIQAMACGCPVVSTDCPSGPREILAGGRHGALVPVGDSEALAGAIEETWNAPPPARQLVERAGAFGVAASVDRYLELLTPRPAPAPLSIGGSRPDSSSAAARS